MIGHHDHIPRPASGTDLGILRKKLAEIAPGIPVLTPRELSASR